MKAAITALRMVVVLGFLIGMQVLIRNAEIIRSQTYQMMPYAVVAPLAAILFGALLRSDVFFQKHKVFKVDWLSLVLIGLPTLLVTLATPIAFTVLASMPLPKFYSILMGNQIQMLAGVAFGYTVINSLFASGSKE